MSAALSIPAAATAEAPEIPTAPGLYGDWPADFYHRHPAINCSRLKWVGVCPAKIAAEGDAEPSSAMVRGTVTHAALFEPHLLETDFYAADVTFNERHAAYKDAVEKAAGRRLVKQKDYDTALRMRDAVHAHSEAREIMASGLLMEQSALWRDPVTGLLCRGRADGIRPESGWRAIIDVKTTTDASPRRFRNAAWDMRYDMQAAFYTWGFSQPEVLGWEVEHFIFVAVESKPPFVVQPYIVSPTLMELGQRRVREALDRYAELKSANHWPGYSEGLESLDAPTWAA